MRAVAMLPVLILLVGGAEGTAQVTPQQQVEMNTPAWTKRAPETGDFSANPTNSEQTNRMRDGLDGQGLPRDKAGSKGGTRTATSAEITIGSQVRDKRNKPVGT